MERSGISAARREQLTRRREAARRRSLLAAVLGSLTLVIAVVTVVTPVPWFVAAIPAALLGTVLVLGRRAVIGNSRADAELARRERLAVRAQQSARRSAQRGGRLVGRPPAVAKPSVARTGPIGRVAHPSDEETSALFGAGEVVAALSAADQGVDSGSGSGSGSEVGAGVEVSATVEREAPSSGKTWDARPVPRPTYAVKPAAARWEPAPMSAEIERVSRRLAEWDADADSIVDDGVVVEVADDGSLFPAAEADGSLGGGLELGRGLDSVLDRRRAVGE